MKHGLTGKNLTQAVKDAIEEDDLRGLTTNNHAVFGNAVLPLLLEVYAKLNELQKTIDNLTTE